jgi:hypothetical protein
MKKETLLRIVKEELASVLKEYSTREDRDDDWYENEGWKAESRYFTEDGWDDAELADLLYLFDDIDKVQYEIKNTVRGGYGGFGDTPEELGQYLQELGNQLIDIGSEIEQN